MADKSDVSLWEQIRRHKLAYYYILPSAIVMALITAFPILYQMWMAFTNFNITHLRNPHPQFVGIANFIKIFKNQVPLENFNFWRTFGFNVVWTFANVFLHVTIGISLAVALNTPRLALKKIYRTLLVIPWAVPSYISALIWKNMFDVDFGAVNQILGSILGHVVKIPWLTNPNAPIKILPFLSYAFYADLITNVWLGFPFMMVVATGALQSIPHEIYEAAEIDGVNERGKFFKITLPLIRSAMLPAIMLGIVWTFNQFNVIYLVSGGGPLGTTEILVTQAYKIVNPGGLYGIASAFGLVVFFILLGITLFTNRVTKATESQI
ncbi:carbohydrate ABC transporter permease [Caldisericum exile]|uniref:ABC transporter permease protein n=1 Tax=Caldisericum exile (strain DSM 21853 / NBRC 104410 / AZM16c01) TaxID=511051 RepID=A0A7U6JGN4_CALEA|nr:sugar ABC transporter permease [Caldisericum exile]BAL80512.1 putative ABC transporter permease protein [Caldisericum exile AZM16c01]